jgi:TRAP-type C4-dicarboxylate transport system permease small subunit
MVGLFVGINVTFALPFTALSKRHVTVNIFLSRFPKRLQHILGGITSFIELAFWAVVAWTTLGVIMERWTNEATLDIQLPMLPFRSIWFIGLIIFCLVLFLDVIDALRKGVKK